MYICTEAKILVFNHIFLTPPSNESHDDLYILENTHEKK